jgi:YidC/Oxa1 family membrane protein insertase
MKFDKNTVIGLSLMLLIAVGFSWYSAKNKAEAAANAPKQTEQTAPQASTPAPESTAVVANNDTTSQAQVAVLNTARYGSLDAAAMPSEETYTVLSNSKIRVKISSKGGLLHSAELLEADYKKYKSDKQVQLWDTAQSKMDIAWTVSYTHLRAHET